MIQDENEGGKAGQAKQDDQVAALLPFYVNGTLSDADTLLVERALAGSPLLRAELSHHRSLYHIVKTGGAVLTKGDDIRDDNIQANLDIVLGRIGAQTPAADPNANAIYTAVSASEIGTADPKATMRSFGQMLGFLHPKRWHPVAALSLALAVPAQAALIAHLSAEKKQEAVQMAALEKRLGELEFQLASGPATGPATGPASGAARGGIIIALRDDANWAAVSQLLIREGLSILSGPHDGALTLSNAAKGAALDAQIIRLKASPLVASVDKAA